MTTSLKITVLALIALGCLQHASAGVAACRELFEAKSKGEIIAPKPGVRFNRDPKIFETMADRVAANRAAFMEILARVDNVHGATYEVEKALKTLRGVRLHEI